DPKESIDLHGFTATFIQYAHARICSVIRKSGLSLAGGLKATALEDLEKNLLLQIEQFPAILEQAGREYNPSALCNYAFRLAQTFNTFFDKHHINNAETEEKKILRLHIAAHTAATLRQAMGLLGISVPDKM